MNTNKGGNFKIRVVENIGKYSIESFGKIGTVFEVNNGKFKDKEGFTWINDGKTYKSIEDINNQINKEDLSFRTRFELAKEQQDEYSLTIQDIVNEEDEKVRYRNILGKIFIYKEEELISDDKEECEINELYSMKHILGMRFKKLKPKQTKKYIDTMKAVQMISENKIVWCEYNDSVLKFNNPKTSKIRTDVLLKGKFYLLINEDEMED